MTQIRAGSAAPAQSVGSRTGNGACDACGKLRVDSVQSKTLSDLETCETFPKMSRSKLCMHVSNAN